MAEQNLRMAEEDLGWHRASLEAIQGSTAGASRLRREPQNSI